MINYELVDTLVRVVGPLVLVALLVMAWPLIRTMDW